MLRLLIALLLMAAFPLDALAQEGEAPTYSHNVEKSDLPMSLRFERISEGLMSADITAITQDGTGFLWVGGQEGLARYDGHEFTLVSGEAGSATGFTGKSISSMTVDTAGRLYVGTYETGLFVYDPASDVFTVLDEPRKSPAISALFSDREDNLWVGYSEGGYSIRRADGTWAEFSKPSDSADPVIIRKFLQAKNGYWLATVGMGVIFLDKIEGATEIVYSPLVAHFESDDDEKRYLTSASIADIALDQDGSLWIATSDAGLNHLNTKTHEITAYSSGRSKRSLVVDALTTVIIDRQNNLWIGSKSGLALFDRKLKNFHRFQSSDVDSTTLPFSFVTTGFVDAGGVIWIGHFTNGLAKFHPDQLKTPLYRSANGALSLAVSGETLWTGTYDGLWAYDFAEETLTKYHEFHSEEEDFVIDGLWVTAIITDEKDGSIWASTFSRGIVHFHPGTDAFEYFDTDNSELASNNVKAMVKGPKGNIWIGTFDAGLQLLNVSDGTWSRWDQSSMPGLGSDYVSVVQLDTDGTHLWLGSTDGIVRLDPITMETAPYTHVADDPSTLPEGQVYALWQTKDTMWIGTSNGLAELNLASGSVRRYGKEEGLVHDQVYGVVEADGEIWLSTNGGGIQRLDASRTTFTTYLADDGMQGLEYAQGAYAKLANGQVVLGGTQGFNLLSSKGMERSARAGALVITSVDVANKPFQFGGATWDAKKVSMTHSSGIVKFKFASLDFLAPKLMSYKYRLKGFESDWREVGAEQRFATYTNLDGGDYKFEVLAQAKGGEWGEVTSIKLRVAPPLWMTWWAILIYVTILGLVIAAYVRYQRQKLYSLEQEAKANKAENDLELTGAVQAGFLPKESAVATDLVSLLGYYRPAESCSGDWWWHEKQADGRHSILVGDVTGHGPGPAMVTAAVATAYRVQSLASDSTMETRLQVLNDEVLRVSGGKYQMTLTAFTIDVETGAFEIHSAGGLPVMKHEPNTKKASSLPCRGTPLGTEALVIGNIKGQLSPGARVIVYTDGIPEIDMPNGRQIGMRRFASLFAETQTEAVPLAMRHIVKTAEEYLEERPQDDDWTFVILEWGGKGATQPVAASEPL